MEKLERPKRHDQVEHNTLVLFRYATEKTPTQGFTCET